MHFCMVCVDHVFCASGLTELEIRARHTKLTQNGNQKNKKQTNQKTKKKQKKTKKNKKNKKNKHGFLKIEGSLMRKPKKQKTQSLFKYFVLV